MTQRAQYAVIKTGAKQYKVKAGDVIDVELLEASAQGEVEFKEVLLVCDGGACRVGAPTVAGCIVRGKVVSQVRGPKVFAYKYKRRKNYSRKVGHRQDYTRVTITELAG